MVLETERLRLTLNSLAELLAQIEQLPPERRPFYQDHLARIIVDVQDADGSWWDYPLYDYHQQYGTAYAIMTLHRCRRPPP